MVSVIGVNITYNPYGWKNIYVNPRAGHKYARTYPGHEALNFHFDKSGIDDNNFVYGYVQWKYLPKKFKNGGLVIFYSNNYLKNVGEIIGIYGNATILDSPIEHDYKGFQNNKLSSNIKALKNLSILFPIPLQSRKYKKGRFIGQVGFSYYDKDVAADIISDEIILLRKAGGQFDEFQKLQNIYHYLTGTKINLTDDDISQQMELEEIHKNRATENIIQALKNIKPSDPEEIKVNNKTYKRDNYTIALLKIYREFKCQICGTTIIKKDKKGYIEAAHITPKKDKGNETPENILILCPNHHKEFDIGLVNIKNRTKHLIQFDMNGQFCEIDLRIQ